MALERTSVRVVTAAIVLVVLVVAGVDLGRRATPSGLSLDDCLAAGELCIGREFFMANLEAAGPFADGAIPVKLASGTVIRLQGWPSSLPYPETGMALAASGPYLGAGRIAVLKAELLPLDGMDRVFGVLAVVLWLSTLLAYGRKGWLEAQEHRG